MEFSAAVVYCRGAGAALIASGPAHFEKVAKIGGKANLDPKMPGAIGVIAKTDPLIADCLPKEFGALDRNRVARQRNDAIRMNVRVGKINRERNIVVLNDRTQQQRPLALEAKRVPGHIAGIVEIEPFMPRAHDSDVAVLVENRESIAMFQATQRSLDQGPHNLDIVLGQVYQGVHAAFRAAQQLMRIACDVRSPLGRVTERRLL